MWWPRGNAAHNAAAAASGHEHGVIHAWSSTSAPAPGPAPLPLHPHCSPYLFCTSSAAPRLPAVEPGTERQWIFWLRSGVRLRASQLNSHCRPNWKVESVQRERRGSSSWTCAGQCRDKVSAGRRSAGLKEQRRAGQREPARREDCSAGRRSADALAHAHAQANAAAAQVVQHGCSTGGRQGRVCSAPRPR